ncbi:40S ribosomal protein S27-like [Lontra canadensis]|uniref:40S ribosomal protein S27-like n=1 Tax=Lontra canadensis TaxID=76717 RepID=UPI0013F37500|nr:40S ribosomal protein S27-like [Lontra canadensis]
MPLVKDLLHPSWKRRGSRRKKGLVQSPKPYPMDVKCHAETVVLCVGCSTVLCQPTGGKARLTEGCFFLRKQHESTLNQASYLGRLEKLYLVT